MGLAVLGLVLNGLACFAFVANAELGMGFAAVGAMFWLVQLLGTLLLGSDNTRGAGYALVWVGAVFFIPLGLIGPLGARSYVRRAEQDEFMRNDSMSTTW